MRTQDTNKILGGDMNVARLSPEQVGNLIEVETLCFFTSLKDRRDFRSKVCAQAGVSKYNEILEQDYEQVLEFSKSMLRARGQEILKGLLKRQGTKSSRNHTLNEKWLETTESSDDYSGGFY